jgi:mannose-6-phosphate isomerase-like protein (cupin superfamily)
MKVIEKRQLEEGQEQFEVLHTTDRTQVAVMVLKEGETSGEYGTDHPHADQTLIVLEGSGSIKCEGKSAELKPGDVVLIPAGAKHQVIGPNRTFNVYSPVAYPDD